MTNTTNFPETAAKLAEVTAFESVLDFNLSSARVTLTKLQATLTAPGASFTGFAEFNAADLVKAEARVTALESAAKYGLAALASHIKFLLNPGTKSTSAFHRAALEARVDVGWELLAEFKTYLDVTQIV